MDFAHVLSPVSKGFLSRTLAPKTRAGRARLEVLVPGGPILLLTPHFVSVGTVSDHGHEKAKVEVPRATKKQTYVLCILEMRICKRL